MAALLKDRKGRFAVSANYIIYTLKVGSGIW